VAAGLIAALIVVGGLVCIPIVSPATGAAVADWLRGIIGPQATAEIESLAFNLQDVFNRARYQVSGGQSQLNWDNPANTPANAAAPQSPSPAHSAIKPVTNRPTVQDAPARTPSLTIQPSVNAVTAPSAVTGWQAFGAIAANGDPIMARAVVQPDPARPYAQAALVRIDLSKVQLHLVAGTVEPIAVKGTPPVARPGDIPASDQTGGRLLAAFNGGFKAIHGGYGMQLENGVTLRPPLAGMATIGLYSDGSVRIGAWGRDIQSGGGLIAFRQNCPLLVDAGQINPHVNDENRKEWGYTVKNLDTTWRSGVGLSQDGRFLIYAAGNSLTVEALAHALQQAGAEYAMQLDINGYYTRFVTYSATAGQPLTAYKLLKEMTGDPTQFLRPYDRDFFYIVSRPAIMVQAAH
jgi:hypothetical protein